MLKLPLAALTLCLLCSDASAATPDPRAARDAFLETVLRPALPQTQMIEFTDTGEGRKFACFAKVGAAFQSEGFARMTPAWVGGTPFKLEPGHLGLRLQCDIGGQIGLREISSWAKHDKITIITRPAPSGGSYLLELGCVSGAEPTTCLTSAPVTSSIPGRTNVAFQLPDQAAAERLATALRQLKNMLRDDDALVSTQVERYAERIKKAQETCAKSSIKFVGGPWLNATAYRSEAMHLVSYHAALIDGQKNPNFGQMCVNGHTIKFLCVHTIRYEGEAPDGGVHATAIGFEENSLEEKSIKHHIKY